MYQKRLYFVKYYKVFKFLLIYGKCTKKRTQKVFNIVSHLPTYYDKGTNKLGQVINLSKNTGFAFFFKSIFLEELLKFSYLKKERFIKNEAY